jgi:uncharacterized protein (DUF58 family)
MAIMTRLRVLIALLVVMLFMAVSTNYGLYYRLTYILSLVLVLSYLWTWLNGRWVTVTVERDRKITNVGGHLEERVSVANRCRHMPVGWVELREDSDMPDHGGAMVITLPRASYESWTFQIPCRRRGNFSLGPLNIVSGDPLGLFRRKRVYGEPYSFLVYPATTDLPNLFVPVSDLQGESTTRQYTHVVTPSATGIRDYVPGDGFNRVHWRTTARTGKLMVKEFDLEQSTNLWIVLDMHGAVQAGEGDESTEEYGVAIAASIAKKYLDAGLSVGLIACGESELLLRPNPGASQLGRVLEALAMVRGTGTMALGDVLEAHGYGFGRYSTVVIITPSAEESWVMSMRHLAQKRVQISVVLLEAQTFGGEGNHLPLVGTLAVGQTPTCVVRRGDDLGRALDFGSRMRMV